LLEPHPDATEEADEEQETAAHSVVMACWRAYIGLHGFTSTADTPADRFGGASDENLPGKLRRMFERVNKLTNVAEKEKATHELLNVEAILKLAALTYIIQGGYRAYRGVLPKPVEAGFGRIKTIDGAHWTTVDEPFALKAADNYSQATNPEYLQHRRTVLKISPTEEAAGKLWEFSLPYEMVRLFHVTKVSQRLFRNDKLPHKMFAYKASIVGWSDDQQAVCMEEIPLADFLDAHINNNSQHNGRPVPPFLSLFGQESSPDLVFVVRFDRPGSTSSEGSSQFVCPVFVQTMLVKSHHGKEKDRACNAVKRTIR